MAFKLKSGNKPSFKEMGSSPLQTHDGTKSTTTHYKDGSAKSKREQEFSKRHESEVSKDTDYQKRKEELLNQGFTPEDADQMIKSGATTGEEEDRPQPTYEGTDEYRSIDQIRSDSEVGKKIRETGEVDPDAPGTPGEPGYEPPVKRSDLDEKGKKKWDELRNKKKSPAKHPTHGDHHGISQDKLEKYEATDKWGRDPGHKDYGKSPAKHRSTVPNKYGTGSTEEKHTHSTHDGRPTAEFGPSKDAPHGSRSYLDKKSPAKEKLPKDFNIKGSSKGDKLGKYQKGFESSKKRTQNFRDAAKKTKTVRSTQVSPSGKVTTKISSSEFDKATRALDKANRAKNVLKNVAKKQAKKGVIKTVGKVASRLLPGVGTVLLAADVLKHGVQNVIKGKGKIPKGYYEKGGKGYQKRDYSKKK